MQKAIQPDEFNAAIAEILEDYGDKAREALDESITETAKEAQKSIRTFNSGRTKWEKYPKGWSVRITSGRLGTTGTVYNKTDYRLTHLLEFGHAKRNGGRTAAFPHIAEVNAFAQSDVLKRLEEKLQT